MAEGVYVSMFSWSMGGHLTQTLLFQSEIQTWQR